MPRKTLSFHNKEALVSALVHHFWLNGFYDVVKDYTSLQYLAMEAVDFISTTCELEFEEN